MRIKKGDQVKVIAGKEKGKTGKVLSILTKTNRVVVEKVNLVKKHKRPDKTGKGGIMEKEGSIHLSNVVPLCSKCDTGIRVGYKRLEDGKQSRICSKCKETIDQ
ncbi:MAG: 50S ribosomal protein L24 [Deltaproteobacteria bacterium]|nr:50S ribosomal protein L24 [Deltaproteobacteria bacterium]